MNEEIYLIEKAWVDPLENRDDFGYKPYGYVHSKKDADALVGNGGRVPMDATWSLKILQNSPPWYRYTKIKLMNVDDVE